MTAKPTTGTVYALVDPRNDRTRYIGATIQPLPVRLKGHLTKPARRVRPWIAELREAGLVPRITPVRENVPADDLLTAETEEIARILGAGGTLLNEHGRALGEEMNRRRCAAEQRAGWRLLADTALRVFGGPIPPGALAEVIPGDFWHLMTMPEQELTWHAKKDRGEPWRFMRCAWPELRQIADDYHRQFDYRMDQQFAAATQAPCSDRAATSHHLALLVWFAAAVEPWWHLANLAGLTADSGTFIAWAGRDAGTREALEFIASRCPAMAGLGEDWERDRHNIPGPGLLLATAAAAYTGTLPPKAVQADVLHCLTKLAEDHQLTRPLAGLLLRLDPAALDSAFGPDIAAKVDGELGLPHGTSADVLRAIVKRIGYVNDRAVKRALDRAAGEFSVQGLPDYGACSGRGVLGARIVGAHIVQAGLGTDEWDTPEDYLAKVWSLWVPDVEEQRRAAAA